jgi:hypothetical protein
MRSVSLASAVTEVKTPNPPPVRENARLAGHLVAISKTRPGFF